MYTLLLKRYIKSNLFSLSILMVKPLVKNLFFTIFFSLLIDTFFF